MYEARRVEKGNGETCYPKKKRHKTQEEHETKTTQEEELEEGQFSPSFLFSVPKDT